MQRRGKLGKVVESRGKSLKMVKKIKEDSPGKGVHGARVFCGICCGPQDTHTHTHTHTHIYIYIYIGADFWAGDATKHFSVKRKRAFQ